MRNGPETPEEIEIDGTKYILEKDPKIDRVVFRERKTKINRVIDFILNPRVFKTFIAAIGISAITMPFVRAYKRAESPKSLTEETTREEKENLECLCQIPNITTFLLNEGEDISGVRKRIRIKNKNSEYTLILSPEINHPKGDYHLSISKKEGKNITTIGDYYFLENPDGSPEMFCLPKNRGSVTGNPKQAKRRYSSILKEILLNLPETAFKAIEEIDLKNKRTEIKKRRKEWNEEEEREKRKKSLSEIERLNPLKIQSIEGGVLWFYNLNEIARNYIKNNPQLLDMLRAQKNGHPRFSAFHYKLTIEQGAKDYADYLRTDWDRFGPSEQRDILKAIESGVYASTEEQRKKIIEKSQHVLENSREHPELLIDITKINPEIDLTPSNPYQSTPTQNLEHTLQTQQNYEELQQRTEVMQLFYGTDTPEAQNQRVQKVIQEERQNRPKGEYHPGQ
jgi:hypothetical protein